MSLHTLFIANVTKKHQHFAYRVPESEQVGSKVFFHEIPIGGQAKIYKESEIDVLEYIIRQHQNCPQPWLIPVDELSRHRGYIGLVYQFDKEIKPGQIERKILENDDALIVDGQKIRTEAAIAMRGTIEEQAQQTGTQVGTVEVEIVEEVKTGESAEGKLAEGVEVSPEGKKPGRRKSS